MKNRLIFINFWNKGGMKHYSDALVNILSKDNEVFYFTNYRSGLMCKNVVFNISLNPFNPLNYLALASLIFQIFIIKPNTIHLNSGYPTLFPVYFLFYFFNSVVTVHDSVSHEGERCLKKVFHKIQLFVFSVCFKKIIVHSEKIKAELPRFIKQDKIYIVSHVNLNFLAKDAVIHKKKGSKFSLLFFGRILEYKGLKYLVEAFNQLDQSQYSLTIAGEGKIDLSIANNNIKIINRFIADHEIAGLFNECDVVVLPYLSGSQSGVIYLAYAFNKPIIATNVGSFGEVVDNGKTGLLINSRSAADLTGAIRRMSEKSFYGMIINNVALRNRSDDAETLTKLTAIYAQKN